jgi:hypothetical protein
MRLCRWHARRRSKHAGAGGIWPASRMAIAQAADRVLSLFEFIGRFHASKAVFDFKDDDESNDFSGG